MPITSLSQLTTTRSAEAEVDPVTTLIQLALTSERVNIDQYNHIQEVLWRCYTNTAGRFERRKRAFDVIVSALLIGLLGPLLLIICILIKITDPGPILFRQVRFCRNGATFKILKFRTLYVDCADPWCREQVRLGDNRVTPIGRWLRLTNFDELPQLFNVLRGEMSLVGPRPHCVGMMVGDQLFYKLFPDHHVRYLVRPGVTGWAQVNGSSGSIGELRGARRRLDLDLQYLESMSLSFDINILLLTLCLTFTNILNCVKKKWHTSDTGYT
jgi:polysaccharide biosynthesis protein PslA